MSYWKHVFAAGWCCVLFASGGSGISSAQDFRVETEVFRGDSKTPISENLTLYNEGLAYDFMLDARREPSEITIYDSRQQKLILIDVNRRVRAELTVGQVQRFLDALLNGQIVREEHRFLVDPQLDERFDPATGWLTLSSDRISYRVRGDRPKDEVKWNSLVDAMDQFVKLNATDPGRMPPFARLKLNDALRRHRIVPTEVNLVLHPRLPVVQEKIDMRTRHQVIWQLSRQDHVRIDNARRIWVEAKLVPLSEYREARMLPIAEAPAPTISR